MYLGSDALSVIGLHPPMSGNGPVNASISLDVKF